MHERWKGGPGIKVIGAGWGRTGTLSFKTAMDILYGSEGGCYHMVKVHEYSDYDFWVKCAKNPEDIDFDKVFSRPNGERFVASCDWPSSAFWKEQLKQYPDARVVLTYRDAESWYRSCCETIFVMNPRSPYSNLGVRTFCLLAAAGSRPQVSQKVIFEYSLGGSWKKDNVIAAYNAHIEDVKATCPKDRLLVHQAKDGWEPLCTFLGMPVPSVPYPHVNDMEAFQSRISHNTSWGYLMGIGLLGIPFLLVPGPPPESGDGDETAETATAST